MIAVHWQDRGDQQHSEYEAQQIEKALGKERPSAPNVQQHVAEAQHLRF